MAFKVGGIIRKISKEGFQYGPYMMVESITKSNVEAYYINPPDDGTILLSRNNVVMCSMVTLIISDSDMKKIIDNDLPTYVHKFNKLWASVADTNPDLVCLKSSNKRVIFSGCLFQKIIRNKIIKEAIYKNERDIVERVPCIRVYLGSKLMEEDI
jgi:hypothetical protein